MKKIILCILLLFSFTFNIKAATFNPNGSGSDHFKLDSDEVKLAYSTPATWNNGTFFEAFTYKKGAYNSSNNTYPVTIYFYLCHYGSSASYCYQESPVYVFLNGVRQCTWSSLLNVHVSNSVRLAGSVTLNITAGVSYTLSINSNGYESMTQASYYGSINFPKPTYKVIQNHYYQSKDNWVLFKSETINRTYGSSFTPYNVECPKGYESGNNYGLYDEIDRFIRNGIVDVDSFIVTNRRLVNVHYYPKTYTITYNSNGGSLNTTTQSFKYDRDEKIMIETPIKKGYIFSCWLYKRESDGYTVIFNPNATIPEGYENFTLEAIYRPIRYEIKYDGNGANEGSVANSIHYYDNKPNVSSDNLLSSSATIQKGANEYLRTTYDLASIIDTNGCGKYLLTFDCFADKEGTMLVYMQNGSGSKYYFEQNFTVSVNRNTYAFVVDIVPYMNNLSESYLAFYGTYNSGCIPNVSNISLYKIDDEATDCLNTNTYLKENHIFAGWNSKADGSGTMYSENEKIINLSNLHNSEITLYAIWKDASYKPTLNTKISYYYQHTTITIDDLKRNAHSNNDSSNINITSIKYNDGTIINNPTSLDTSKLGKIEITYKYEDSFYTLTDTNDIYIVSRNVETLFNLNEPNIYTRFINYNTLYTLDERSIWNTLSYKDILYASLHNKTPLEEYFWINN